MTGTRQGTRQAQLLASRELQLPPPKLLCTVVAYGRTRCVHRSLLGAGAPVPITPLWRAPNQKLAGGERFPVRQVWGRTEPGPGFASGSFGRLKAHQSRTRDDCDACTVPMAPRGGVKVPTGQGVALPRPVGSLLQRGPVGGR